jgi:hypothetical protein
MQSNTITIVLFVISLAMTWVAALIAWSKHTKSEAGPPTLGWFEALFLSTVCTIVLAGWLGVLLASCGIFSIFYLALILLVISGIILWVHRPLALSFRRPGRHELILGVLLLGCSVVYLRPHEYILGGSDAGSYMNIGVTLTHSGDFVLHDDWTSFLSEHTQVTLREQPPVWKTHYLQFVGWYIDDGDPSRVIPQFYPFHPTLLAVGISVAGLYGGLLVTPLWGILDIAAVYFLTKRLFGPQVGLLAALLLAITPTQIWFARYPTTEPLTLLLVFAGLLAFQALWDSASAKPIWGILGGAALGAAFLTRIDLPALALLVIVALASRWGQWRWSKSWSAYVIVLGLFSAHAALSSYLISWPYVWNTYRSLFALLQTLPPLALFASILIGTGFTILGIVLLWRKRTGRSIRWVVQITRSNLFRWSLVVSVILLSTYAYFIRPKLSLVHYATGWPAGNQVPILDAQNWVRLGWYLTPLGLLLATLGLAVILRRESLERMGLFLSVGVLTTIQYVYRIFNMPYHIYAMRRYVPIVIPMLAIYMAVAIVAVYRWRPGWPAKAGGILLACILAIGLLYQSRFVLPQRDFRGAVEQLTELNDQLEPGAIIVINEPPEKFFADFYGVPLRFIFGHDVATIREINGDLQSFVDALLARAAAENRPIQLIAIEPIAPEILESLTLKPVQMVPVKLQTLGPTYFEYPSAIQTEYRGIEIYNVLPKDTSLAPNPSGSVTVDIGTLDTIFIRSGFYEKEVTADNSTVRWTAGTAILDIPLTTEKPVTVEVRAKTLRPAHLPSATATVWLDGKEIGQFRPDTEWHTFSFQGHTSPSEGTSSLHLETKTFNPAGLGMSSDARDLGFLIDWIKVEPR